MKEKMILATYQPTQPNPNFKMTSSVITKISEKIGYYPVFCFPARTIPEFIVNSILAAPNCPEELYVFETDDYIPIDIVQLNIAAYNRDHNDFDNTLEIFNPSDEKYCEYLVKEIPQNYLYKINLIDAIFNTKYTVDGNNAENYMVEFMDNMFNLCLKAARDEVNNTRLSSNTKKGLNLLKARINKEAFQIFLAPFIHRQFVNASIEECFSFDIKNYHSKKANISHLLSEQYNGEFEPSYAKQDEILRKLYSCVNPFPFHKNLGRNDDCPCGSGKKYKKCCLHKYRI